MFENVKRAPPDPILGLSEAFTTDPSPHKINLSVGVYQNARGETPVLDCVKKAERHIQQNEGSKSYKPIGGDPALGHLVRELLFGADHELATSGRAQTVHTPGGTGALRVVGDLLRQQFPGKTVWLSEPTWANHSNVFEAAGVPLATYAYFDRATGSVDLRGLLSALEQVPPGDCVLLHACCHNPTGADPDPEEWRAISRRLAERELIPVMDFAYQGFGRGLAEDAEGLRVVAADNPELFVCSSFSKNFGLYSERVGALTVVGKTREQAQAVFSQLKTRIRANYSNPPAHGGEIVRTILSDAELREQWERELAQMRERILSMRRLFVQTLKERSARRDYSFMTRQSGMFSISGLTKEQVNVLKERHSIYIVGSGRINVAGITPANVGALCQAIAELS